MDCSHTQVKEADILVSAIGKAQFVQGSWLKSGVVVIDVGTNYIPGDYALPRSICSALIIVLQMQPRSPANVSSAMWTTRQLLLSRPTLPPSLEESVP